MCFVKFTIFRQCRKFMYEEGVYFLHTFYYTNAIKCFIYITLKRWFFCRSHYFSAISIDGTFFSLWDMELGLSAVLGEDLTSKLTY